MMPVDRELILLAQASKRFVLPACAVVVDEIECFRLHNKKTTIDNLPVARVLFAKASGPRTIGRQVDCAEAAGKLNRRYGCKRPLLMMEFNKLRNVELLTPSP